MCAVEDGWMQRLLAAGDMQAASAGYDISQPADDRSRWQ